MNFGNFKMKEYDIVKNMRCWLCKYASKCGNRPYCRLDMDIPDPCGNCQETFGIDRFKLRLFLPQLKKKKR